MMMGSFAAGAPEGNTASITALGLTRTIWRSSDCRAIPSASSEQEQSVSTSETVVAMPVNGKRP